MNMQSPDQLDAHRTYIVLGSSLAGFAAALELRKKGHTVRLYELLQDIPMRDAFAVRSPRENVQIRGGDLESAFTEEVRNAGVQFEEREVELTEWLEAETNCQVALRSLGSEPVSVHATAVVFGPNGVLPRAAHPEGWESLIGRGVSESASSDGPFYRGKPVCIYGCGLWAVDQARMLSQWSSKVVHLCDQTSLSSLAREQDGRPSNVALWLKSRITAIRRGSDHELGGISFTQDGNKKETLCSALFLAPEPIMDWRVLGRAFENGPKIESKRFIRAGSAAGIPFGASAELFQNGIEAADRAVLI